MATIAFVDTPLTVAERSASVAAGGTVVAGVDEVLPVPPHPASKDVTTPIRSPSRLLIVQPRFLFRVASEPPCGRGRYSSRFAEGSFLAARR